MFWKKIVILFHCFNRKVAGVVDRDGLENRNKC